MTTPLFELIQDTLEHTPLPQHARQIALLAHHDQMYGDLPYIHHLDHVVSLLQKFHYNTPEILHAGLLHDVIEDTPITPEFLAKFVPQSTLAMVKFCTDEEGPNRKTRKAKTYARMKQAVQNNAPHTHASVAVKLADRLANVTTSHANNNTRLLSLYRAEHPALQDALTIDGEHQPMWEALHTLLNA